MDARIGRGWLIGSAYVVWFAGLAAAYYVAMPDYPAIAAALSGAVVVSAVAAIATGVRRHHPASATPWALFAGGVLATGAARVAFTAHGNAGPLDLQELRLVLPVFGLHLVMFVLFVLALLRLSNRHVAGNRWIWAVDIAVVVLGTGLLAWVVVAGPWTTRDITDLRTAVRIGYVTRDVLLLAALTWLVAAVRWSASLGLLTASLVSLFAYDGLLRLDFIRNVDIRGTPLELLWMAFYVIIGAAALVPSMARYEAASQRSDENGVTTLLLVAVSAIIPFVLLIVGTARDSLGGPAPVELAAAAMLVLVLIRMTSAAVRLRRSLAQAGVVADVSAELVAASDQEAVSSAVTRAAARLLGPRARHTVSLTESTVDTKGDGRPHGASRSALDIPITVPGPGAGARELTIRVRGAPGGLIWIQRPLQAVAGQASLALARVRLNDEVIRTRRDEYFRALVQNSTDVILILDDDERIRYASPSAEKLFETSTVDGLWLPSLVDPADRAGAARLLNQVSRPGTGRNATTVRTDWRLDGRADRRVEVSCLDLRAEEAIRGVVVTLRDVTERRRLEEQLTQQAYHDPLTGLGNRSLFTAGVEQAAGGGRRAAVLFIDLDDFKVINDGFGHVLGDSFLQSVADRIRSVVEPVAGLAARVGGDEFAVLLSNLDDEDAAAVADGIVAALGRHVTLQGESIRCGASVGLATTADADTAEDLMRQADLALYEAKGAGKQQWRRYEPTMRAAVMQRLELRADLADALGAGALRLEFQPIVDLDRGATVGFESLLRWQHPTRGRLGPAEFIDLAEESGLIGPIGAWVVGSAVREAVRWAAAPRAAPLYVSVNVSPRQFRTPDIFDLIHDQLRQSGLPPDRLMLEITEGVLLEEDETVLDGLTRLHELGVRIAIDDFGTGYSGLGYLQRMPLDVVKLDRLFTRTMAVSQRQRELVAGIVHLAGTLQLDVIAEGVETTDEYFYVRRAGCAYGQGFVISPPLPSDEALQWASANGRFQPPTLGPD
jgi:diguanylate cyclase (GGDEF)-like protein/PAS domain S-box-containing protein